MRSFFVLKIIIKTKWYNFKKGEITLNFKEGDFVVFTEKIASIIEMMNVRKIENRPLKDRCNDQEEQYMELANSKGTSEFVLRDGYRLATKSEIKKEEIRNLFSK